MDSRDLQGLMEAYVKVCAPVDEAVYGGEPKKPEAPKDDRMVVTAADKKGNTPAYQKFKAGHKGYKAADHLGEESVDEAVKGASPHAMEMRKGDAADRRKGIKPLSAKKGEDYAKYKMSQMAHSERKRMGEEVEQVDELYKGKHGQSETEYQDSRSPGGKMVSGTSKLSGAAYSYRGVKNTGPNPAGGSEKPKAQGRMTSGQRTELQYRKANLMKKEELDIFDAILEYLVAEGYAATNKEALVIMANMSEEWRSEIDEGMTMKDFQANRKKAQRSAASADAKKRGHVDRFTGKPYGTEEAASRRKDIHTPEKKPSRDAARDAARGETGHGGPLRAKKVRKAKAMGELGEGVDLFDYLLEYLVAEGYAATNKEALVIMANMSEEWRTEIIESQYARENPEKYEREQAKKTSKKEKAMNDPHTGINSPAFAEFMRKQMGR